MKYLHIFIFLFIGFSLKAQEPTFQRVFPYEDQSLVNGAIATNSSGFYLLSWLDDEEDEIQKVHLTRHATKGGVDWNFNYNLEDSDIISLNMDLLTVEDDAVLICINGILDGDIHSIVIKIDAEGNPIWNKSFINSDIDLNNFQTDLTSSTLGSIVIGGNSAGSDGNTAMFLAKLESSGETTWTNIYDTGSFNYCRSIIQSEIDTNLTLAAGHNVDDQTVFISEIGNDGSLSWYNEYEFQNVDQNADQFAITLEDITSGIDSNYAVVGNAVAPDLSRFNFVMKLDQDGNPLWTRSIDLEGTLPNERSYEVLIDSLGNTLVLGRFIQEDTIESFEYLISLDTLGTLNWSAAYTQNQSQAASLALGEIGTGDLIQTKEGYIFSATSVDLISENNRALVVATDLSGNAICQDSLDVTLDTLMVEVNQIDVDVSEYIQGDSTTVIIDTIPGYALPSVILQDTMYCPADPILYTLDAEHPDAVGYLWGDGETTPQITVTEEGQYTVIVSFDSLTCYTLCDTANITRFQEPSVQFIVDNRQWCETQEFILNAAPIPGKPPYAVTWSTGETTQSINVGFGTYNYTLVDDCGEQLDTMVTVSEANIPPPTGPLLIWDQQQFCETGNIVIVLGNASEFTNIIWSTGEQNLGSIMVPDFGVYSMTAINCEQPVNASIEIMAPVEFNAELQQFDSDCGQLLSAVAVGGVEPYSYNWSTGETTSQILATEAGTYAVTISDACREEISDEVEVLTDNTLVPPVVNVDCLDGDFILELSNASTYTMFQWSSGEINEEEVTIGLIENATITVQDNCGRDGTFPVDSISTEVQFPDIFFPGSSEVDNQRFKAFIGCPNLITDYELKVFNQWGKLMYETDNVLDGWNGRINNSANNFQPNDIYMFYASWTNVVDNTDGFAEGDVTLYMRDR